MKMAPHAALAAGKANHVGDAVAVVIADTLAQAKDAAEKVVVDYEPLPAVVDPAKAAAKGAPLIHEVGAEQHDLQLASRRRRRDQRGIQERQARHQARIHQQPAGAERDGAARGARRLRCGERQPDTVERDAEPARRAAGHLRLRRHGAREQAARHRARRRRRLRLEDFHLSGGGRLPVGGAQARPRGEMDLRALGELHHRRARPRSRHQGADGVRRRRQDHRTEGAHHRQSRRLHVDLLVGGADIPLCDAAVGPVRDPAHLLRGRRGLHQHRAGRCLSRRRPPGGDLRGRAAGRSRRPRTRHRSRRAAARRTSSRNSRIRHRWPRSTTPATTTPRCRRRWKSTTTKASASASASPSATASCAASALRPTSRRAALRRHRWSASSAPASACGNPPRCGSIRPARSRF